jgi:hypothetical protein
MEAHNSFNPASKAFYRVIFEIFPMKNRDRSIEPKKLVTYGKFMYGDNLVTRRADRSKGFGRLLFGLNGFWRGGSLCGGLTWPSHAQLVPRRSIGAYASRV